MTTGAPRLTTEVMDRIWLNVVNNVGQHGDFLKTFGLAYRRADANSKVIMYSASIALIEKHKLNDGPYLIEHGI